MPDAHGFTARQIANLAGTAKHDPPGFTAAQLDNMAGRRRPSRTKARRDLSARLAAILDRDGWRCGLCFGVIHRSGWNKYTRPTVDHIWPQSWPRRVWINDRANLRPAHAWCNNARGDEWDSARDRAALERNGFNVAYL